MAAWSVGPHLLAGIGERLKLDIFHGTAGTAVALALPRDRLQHVRVAELLQAGGG